MSNDKTIDQSVEEPGFLHRFRVGLQGIRNAGVDFVSDTVGVVLGAGAGVGSVIVDQTAELFGGDVYEGTGFKSGWDSGNDAAKKLNQGLHWVIDQTAIDNIAFGKVKVQDSTDQTVLDWSEGITTAGTFFIGGVGLAGKAGKGAKLTSAFGKGGKSMSFSNIFRSSANAAGKYGDDAAKAAGKYADDAAKAAGKYGDDAAKAAGKYGDDAAKAASKNAGKATRADKGATLTRSDKRFITYKKYLAGAPLAGAGILIYDKETDHSLMNGAIDWAHSDSALKRFLGKAAHKGFELTWDGFTYMSSLAPDAVAQGVTRHLENAEKLSPDDPDYELKTDVIRATANIAMGNPFAASNIMLKHGITREVVQSAWDKAKAESPDSKIEETALLALQHIKAHTSEHMAENNYGVAGAVSDKAKEKIEETKKDVKETLDKTRDAAQEKLAELQNIDALSGQKLSGLFNRVDDQVDSRELNLGEDAGKFKNYSKLAGLFNTIGGFLSFIPGLGDFVKNIGAYFQKQALDIAKGAISQGGDRFNLTKDVSLQPSLNI